MFSPCYFHVIISIGILESNSLSLSTQSRSAGIVAGVEISSMLIKRQ